MPRRSRAPWTAEAAAPLLFPAPPWQQHAPESVLGRLSGQPPEPGPPPPGFPAAFNGPVFAMQRLHTGPGLRLDCRPGWYFDSLATCERPEIEGRHARIVPPVRRSLDGAGRTAAVGISTVVAWPSDSGWLALAAPMRARAVAGRGGLLHVAPSGMFAPPYSVIANVRRELEEELGLPLDAARLRLAGIAIHRLNQRPEICTLLTLPCPPRIRLNGEFAAGFVRVPLRAGLRTAGLRGFFPPGAAALELAARVLFPAGGRAG